MFEKLYFYYLADEKRKCPEIIALFIMKPLLKAHKLALAITRRVLLHQQLILRGSYFNGWPADITAVKT
jgi:hypothetical protein